MKTLTFLLICTMGISCQKDGNIVMLNNKKVGFYTYSSQTLQPDTSIVVNVMDHGATGDGIADDTKAIRNSIKYARSNGISTVYFPAGTYSVGEQGEKSGIIQLLDGVGLKGSGASTTHIKLSGGRYNPNSIFYQAWWQEPSVSNIVIEGIDFDGNLHNQQYDKSYEYCHALSINKGKNIEIKNCKFQNFRGDGCLFGDTNLPTRDVRITSNVNVHDNEFYNIYREGAMFCCINGASFSSNWVHGDGYLVGGVDIERHSMNETVINVSVFNNTFDFRDGAGPEERGRVVKYRRAVTMGFFYKGYLNGIADGRSAGHKIYGNQVFQGQFDCFGHTNVSITGNAVNNSFEDISGVGYVSPPSINISDAGSTAGLKNVTISNNIISSAIIGNGIAFNNYTNVTAKNNNVSGTQKDGISILNSTGTITSNTIKDGGSIANKVSGIVINGNCSGLVISYNKVINTKTGNERTLNYAIEIGSWNAGVIAPRIEYNTATNMIKGFISEFFGQRGYVTLKNNKQLP